MNRQYPSRPLAGVAVVVQKKNEILLIRRGQPPKKGLWSIPGGLVELGESIRDAAVREVMEECHIEIEVEQVLDVVDFIEKDTEGRIRFHYIITDFSARYVSGTVQAGDDAESAVWVTPEKLAQYPIPEMIQQVIKKALINSAGA